MNYKKITVIISILAILIFIAGVMSGINVEKDLVKNDVSFISLFLYNFSTQLKAIFWGAVTFGIYSIIYLMINFGAMGIIVAQLKREHSLIETLNMFMYHGIFEIPTMILSASLGIYIPLMAIKMYKKKKFEYKNILRILIVITILTVIAAFVEAIITPIFMR